MQTYIVSLQGLSSSYAVTAATPEAAAIEWAYRLPLVTWQGSVPIQVLITDLDRNQTTFTVRPQLCLTAERHDG